MTPATTPVTTKTSNINNITATNIGIDDMKYSIKNDKLIGKDIEYLSSPSVSRGRNVCDFVILHYTGSHGDYKSSNNWAQHPNAKVSWHITIGRNGEVTQLNNLRTIAWHAGRSKWTAQQINRHYDGLNKYSVGIEMANAGKLREVEPNVFKNPYDVIIPIENVMFDSDGTPWEAYTSIQIERAKEIALLIAKEYNCIDILGHNEISPHRKIDPGPLFPLDNLREELYDKEWYKFQK